MNISRKVCDAIAMAICIAIFSLLNLEEKRELDEQLADYKASGR